MLGLVATTWARATNHRPRPRRGGSSRAQLYTIEPTDEQIAVARSALEDRRRRQELARQTLEARQRPVKATCIWADEQQRTSMARSARDQLEQQMEWDRAELERHVGTAWHGAAELAEEGGDERSPAAQRTGGA